MGSRPQRYTGPEVPLQYTFISTGIHAVFVQFQHQGEVVTARFLLDVEEAERPPYKAIVLAVCALVIAACALLLARLGARARGGQ